MPDRKAAQALKGYLAVAELRQDAGLAAMNLAETVRKGNRPMAKELAQAVKDAGLSDDLSRRADAILQRN